MPPRGHFLWAAARPRRGARARCCFAAAKCARKSRARAARAIAGHPGATVGAGPGTAVSGIDPNRRARLALRLTPKHAKPAYFGHPGPSRETAPLKPPFEAPFEAQGEQGKQGAAPAEESGLGMTPSAGKHRQECLCHVCCLEGGATKAAKKRRRAGGDEERTREGT